MNVTLAYRGHSGISDSGARQTFRLVPNLARDLVAFDAPLSKPLRFREAMSALHDVVISDLRFKKRDKSAYEQWKKNEQTRIAALRQGVYTAAVADVAARHAIALPGGLQERFDDARNRYWNARVAYSKYLSQHDPQLWRLLMPCDPVITVAEDVVFFECFSADESSYGCLTVDRDGGFGVSESVKLGTTNVDYSWDLYHHFQAMRSYRQTRFTVDPAGFGVKTEGTGDLREEKIDLPAGWLRGFMTIQSAMTMSSQCIRLERETVYSILAWLRRHKPSTSPRAIRFEFIPGKPVQVVLEPWEQRIAATGPIYDGPPIEPVRVWGARRLLVLARVLPLAERFDVYLLGTGLPHFWVARMGEMRLTAGFSGWTTNDWTRGSAVDLLAPPAAPSPDLISNITAVLHERRSATLADLQARTGADANVAAAAVRHLAHSGQVIADLSAGIFRWRQIMPRALGEAEIGEEHPELAAARIIMSQGRAELTSRADAPKAGYVLGGKIDSVPVEIMVDGDGRIRRGACVCGYFRRFGLRNGPCRHMLALRWRSSVTALHEFRASSWYKSMQK